MLRFFEYATKLGCLSFKIDFWKISNHYFVSDKGYWCAKIHSPINGIENLKAIAKDKD